MEDNGFEEIKESKLKKIFIILLAIFLIILFISYLTTNQMIRDIFAGLIESSKLSENKIKIDKNSNLIFVNNSFKKLSELYKKNINLEFKACLKGEVINNDYIINDIIEPETFEKTIISVTAEPCSRDALVSLHSHPLKHCLPSQQDLRNFEIFKVNNENALMAVMCEEKRFNFYR